MMGWWFTHTKDQTMPREDIERATETPITEDYLEQVLRRRNEDRIQAKRDAMRPTWLLVTVALVIASGILGGWVISLLFGGGFSW